MCSSCRLILRLLIAKDKLSSLLSSHFYRLLLHKILSRRLLLLPPATSSTHSPPSRPPPPPALRPPEPPQYSHFPFRNCHQFCELFSYVILCAGEEHTSDIDHVARVLSNRLHHLFTHHHPSIA